MDGDVFNRRVKRVWKRLAEALGDGLDPTECAYRLENAMAQHLRKRRGIEVLDVGEHALSDPGGLGRDRVVEAMRDLFRREVVDRVAPVLIGRGRFDTFDDAQEFVHQVLAVARLDTLAGALLRRPDGIGLRRPPRPRAAAFTLLNESAPLGDRA
jgi:hypothetical protein